MTIQYKTEQHKTNFYHREQFLSNISFVS